MQSNGAVESLHFYGRHRIGDSVYFNHPDESWIRGTLTKINSVRKKNGFTRVVYGCKPLLSTRYLSYLNNTSISTETYPLDEKDIYPLVESCDESGANNTMNNLLDLFYLHDATILEQVRVRYYENIIYTHIGFITLALNPFDFTLPNYTDDKMPKYIMEGSSILASPSKNLPHVWTVAHHSYWLMCSEKRNQSIIVSGDSGAGKTETAKIILKYISAVSNYQSNFEEKSETNDITRKINFTSPILESFGNAKTRKNDNSSRFGKHMKIFFSNLPNGGIMKGALIEVYLLERSRIVTHAKNERSYHSFYQLLANNGDSFKSQLLTQMHLTCAENYRLTAVGGSTKIEGVDDAEDFNCLVNAMRFIGMTEKEISCVWNTVGALLHLVSLQFIATTDDECSIDMTTKDAKLHVNMVKKLLGLPDDTFFFELTTTTYVTRGETIVRRLRKLQAIDLCEGIAKSLYEALFLWLVSRINNLIKPPELTDQNEYLYIGLLDIFGFENFSCGNSFEQLCINLANETLQNHYNNIIFQRDIEECQREGINTAEIVFYDNRACLDLICGVDFSCSKGLQPNITNKVSILHTLDDESLLAKGSDLVFCEKICDKYGGRLLDGESAHPNFSRVKTDQSSFIIKHYAGDVTYKVDGFRTKNCDTVKDTLKDAIRASTIPFVSSLFGRKSLSHTSTVRSTVGNTFRCQLMRLMTGINATNPHWVRCIKPHSARKPRMFNGSEVMHQMRFAGVLETIKIFQNSFPVRIPFAKFLQSYAVFLKPLPPSVCAYIRSDHIDVAKLQKPFLFTPPDCNFVAELLQRAGINIGSQAQVGKTKVFLKIDSSHVLFSNARAVQNGFAMLLQAAFRRLLSCRASHMYFLLRCAKLISAALSARRSQLYTRQLELRRQKSLLLTYLKEILLLQLQERELRVILEEQQSTVYKCLLEKKVEDWHAVVRILLEKRLEKDVAEQRLLFTEEDKFRSLLVNYEDIHRQVLIESLKLYMNEESRRDEQELEEVVERRLTIECSYRQLRQHLARWHADRLERQQIEMFEIEDTCRCMIKKQETAGFLFIWGANALTLSQMSAYALLLAEELDAFTAYSCAFSCEMAALEKQWLARKLIIDRRELLQLQRTEFLARQNMEDLYTKFITDSILKFSEGEQLAQKQLEERMALEEEERRLLECEQRARARAEERRQTDAIRQVAQHLWLNCLEEGEILKEIKRLETQKKSITAAKIQLTRDYMLLCRRKEISVGRWKPTFAFRTTSCLTDSEEYMRQQEELSGSLVAVQQKIQETENSLLKFRTKTGLHLGLRDIMQYPVRSTSLPNTQTEFCDNIALNDASASEKGTTDLFSCIHAVKNSFNNVQRESNARLDCIDVKKRLETYRRKREKQKRSDSNNASSKRGFNTLHNHPVREFSPLTVDYCLQRNPFKPDWTPGFPDSDGVYWMYTPNGERVQLPFTKKNNLPGDYHTINKMSHSPESFF